jgi:enterochelin esterase-like enzyme
MRLPGFLFVSSFFFGCALGVLPLHALEIPSPGPDSQVQSGVPQGHLTKKSFAQSRIFPGTTRDYWVYVPSQYGGQADSAPAHLLVFQDGAGYVKADGAFRAPVVLDNFIAKGELPVTVAVFVSPGVFAPSIPGAAPRSNRSFEYDSLGDRYARFLVEELLPEALSGLRVSESPSDRGIVGSSSGGIAAWTVAWERPDQFGKVFSSIGSFTNIRGGFVYPALIRKTKGQPKPIRVYLQEGETDVNNLHGHWPLSNQDMAAALRHAGYDFHLEMTGGGHSGQAAGALLPEVLRWLWRK